jgi:hypothetical protein
MAIDILLFSGDIKITDDQPYNSLHDYWDKIGGAKRIPGDLGHFSLMTPEGVR